MSETVPIGGESIIMQSNLSFSKFNNSSVFAEEVSSDELGGTGPAGIMLRFSCVEAFITSSRLSLPISHVETP